MVDAHLQKTLESFGYGYFTCNAEWRFAYVSARAEIFIGISQDEALDRSCWEIFPFTQGTLLEHEFRRAALGEIRDFEYFFEPRSLWFQFRCFPRKGGGISVYFKDITDHKLTIESHLKAKSLLNLALQSGGAGVWEWNFQEGLRWSEEVYRIFGMVPGRDAISLDRWKQSIHPDDLPGLTRQLEAASAHQGRIGFEYRIILPSGTIRWIYDVGDSYGDASGVPQGRAGICYDITERKKAEEEIRSLNATLERRVEERTAQLHASEEQFRVMFEKSDVGMAQADPVSGRLLKVNDALCRFLGSTREELLQRTVADVTHPDDRDASVAQFAALAKGDISGFHEIKHYVRPDGTVVLAHVTVNMVHDETGIPLRTMAVIQDITARTRAEQQLLESLKQNEMLANIIRLTSQPFGVGFPDGRLGIVNPAFERLVGYTGEELMSMSWTEVLTPPEWSESEQRSLAELHRTGTPVKYEKEYVRKDGSRVPVELLVHLMTDAEGNPAYYYSFVTDITERKQHEASLKRNEHLLQLLIEYAPAALAMFDRDMRYLHASRRWLSDYGLTGRDLQGVSHYDVFPELPDRWREAHRRGLSGETVKADAERFERLNGATQWVRWEIRPWYAEEDDVGGIIIFTEDITRQKQFELDLEQARDAAEAGDRAKTEFLATISHEIRTPMNGIVGMTQLMEGTILSEVQRGYLDVIKKSSRNLLSIISDILELARLEANKVTVRKNDFSLRDSIHDVITPQTESGTSKGLRIGTDIPPSVPDRLRGDQLRLKQIILNLLGNAIKFTEKGHVTISVTLHEHVADNVLLRFEVADTGIGITPELMGQIFGPFNQADSSNTRKYGGTGLGLAICSRLTKLLGGRIWAESTEGVGSVFSVELPFEVMGSPEGDHEESAARTAFPRWDGPPLRVLVVDDEEINRSVATEILARAGHCAVGAGNGREALEKWEQEEFDLIIMDVQMPGMDGIRATQAVRKREQDTGRHTPVLALTARALEEERNHIISQGFDGYVAKPFEIDVLFREMKQCLVNKVSRLHVDKGCRKGAAWRGEREG